MELVAVVPFTHDGVTLAPGDHFFVAPVWAAILTRQRKAVWPQQYVSSDSSKRRRTYRRRDLVPQS